MSDFVDQQPVLDRSTLEAWSVCPLQARSKMLGLGQHVGVAAIVGEQCHEIYSSAIREYTERRGIMTGAEVADWIDQAATCARPDVQPQVVEVLRRGRWPWSAWLCSVEAARILRWDGGDGEQSGQLAVDFADCIITGELDFLCNSRFPGTFILRDWKTGWRDWTMDDIADSFQVQLYAYLVFGNYEAAERVEVHVWKARYGQWSSVTSNRSQVDTIQQRILSAVEINNAYHQWLIEKVPGWPEREKCSICDVAAKCPMADLTSREILSTCQANHLQPR